MFNKNLLKKFTKIINDIEHHILVYPDKIEWRVNGNLHRENDKPAVKFRNGSKCWYKYGELHRTNDQPAIIKEGLQEWYVNGRRHRAGKPAIIIKGSDNESNYFNNGQKLTAFEIEKSKLIANF